MAILRSLLFTLVFYSVTLLAVLIAFAAMLFGRRGLIAVALAWARFHRWCVAHLLGIRTRVEGELPTHPVLVASKHQSMFETLELALLLGAPAAIVKRELTRIPLWGPASKLYGVIPVERSGGAIALRRMIVAAQEAFASGRSIVIFPEGTRVRPGVQPPLQPGFAGLYRALAVEVVPVAVDSGRLWPRGAFVKHSGTITIRFGEPVPPGLPRREVEARIHAAINALERGES